MDKVKAFFKAIYDEITTHGRSVVRDFPIVCAVIFCLGFIASSILHKVF